MQDKTPLKSILTEQHVSFLREKYSAKVMRSLTDAKVPGLSMGAESAILLTKILREFDRSNDFRLSDIETQEAMMDCAGFLACKLIKLGTDLESIPTLVVKYSEDICEISSNCIVEGRRYIVQSTEGPLFMPLEDLGLTRRTYNILRLAAIDTTEDLLDYLPLLNEFRGLGQTSIEGVLDALKQQDIPLPELYPLAIQLPSRVRWFLKHNNIRTVEDLSKICGDIPGCGRQTMKMIRDYVKGFKNKEQ